MLTREEARTLSEEALALVVWLISVLTGDSEDDVLQDMKELLSH